MNPLATRHSDEYSASVKSDLLGILLIGAPFDRQQGAAGGLDRSREQFQFLRVPPLVRPIV
jgi:hypothetical protein